MCVSSTNAFTSGWNYRTATTQWLLPGGKIGMAPTFRVQTGISFKGLFDLAVFVLETSMHSGRKYRLAR